MQKMPYKHIAAHLKKTELACRLHYHQLSHGSSRRKRAASLSSSGSSSAPNNHSPVMRPSSMPSPIHEHGSRSASPTDHSTYHCVSPGGASIQLPSISSTTAAGSNTSPRLPVILPKPASMGLTLNTMVSPASASSSPTACRAYPNPLHDIPPPPPQGITSAPASYRTSSSSTAPTSTTPKPASRPGTHHNAPSLRLDCSPATILPSPSTLSASPCGNNLQGASHPVDMARLTAIYNAHRAHFWNMIAAEYGQGANPWVLEGAWRSTSANNNTTMGGFMALGGAVTPITPVTSPEEGYGLCGGNNNVNGREQQQQKQTMKSDKTRISAILGIDASPRSPSEREMVRRMEERCAVGVVGA